MIGSDFDIPIMHQDIASMNMAPMNFGSVTQTSYLGGVQMRPQLEADKLDLINNKDNESKKTAKTILKTLGALLLIGYIPYFRKNIRKAGGIGKYLKKQYTNVIDFFKNLNNPKPTKWQKFKNWFKRR